MNKISFSDFAPKRSTEDLPAFTTAPELEKSGVQFDIVGIRKNGNKRVWSPKKNVMVSINAQVIFDIRLYDEAETLKTLSLTSNDYREGLYDHFKASGRNACIGPVKLVVKGAQGYYAFEAVEETAPPNDTPGADTEKGTKGRSSVKGTNG